MAKIFIGVGHGGNDPGAIGIGGVHEADLNLAIAKACRDELVRHGVTVKMSREKDENDTLAEEIREANAWGPDFAIDIHNNAGGGSGVEVFHSKVGTADDKLAQNVLNAIIAIGQDSRGLKTKLIGGTNRDWFGFVREIKAPSILVECAFVDSADVKIIDTATEQKAMGVAIAKGILKTLGIPYKSATEAKKETPAVKFAVGDKVKVVGKYSASATGKATSDKAKGKTRYVVKVYNGKANPYQLGVVKGNAMGINTTGFAPTESIELVKAAKKSVDEIAKEVIAGMWGNGMARKNNLEKAGYNYNKVQTAVNKILRG